MSFAGPELKGARNVVIPGIDPRETSYSAPAFEATYRFITAMAGDRPGYEEAVRMLFAGDWTAFDAAVECWPEGVRETAREMATGAWRNGAG